MNNQQKRTQSFRSRYGELWGTKTPFGFTQNSMNDPIELAISLAAGAFSVDQIHRFVDDRLIVIERVRAHIQRLAGKKDKPNPFNGGNPALQNAGSGLWRRTRVGDRMAAKMIAEYIDSGDPVPPCCEKLVATIRRQRNLSPDSQFGRPSAGREGGSSKAAQPKQKNVRQTAPSIDELEAVDLAEPESPDRKSVSVSRIVRDSARVRQIKEKHRHQCQLCNESLELPDERRYAEAHHLQPLGGEHRGPDTEENIIVVCPNCHALLDFGAIRLNETSIRRRKLHGPSRRYIEYHNVHVFRGDW